MNAPGVETTEARFFTPGTFVLLVVMGIGYAFGLTRFLTGLSSVTHLNDSYPWGLWVAVDVACGVALAAGGFTTAALVEIFGRGRFRELLRPAILTAWLGYGFVGFALMFDLGRYWNVWQPMFNWQGNSVLFEVGMCVMAYLFVLTVEMALPILEGLHTRATSAQRSAMWARLSGYMIQIRRVVRVVLPVFIVAGVVLSCMHQSSLGALMVIAPSKVHPLWYSPILPVLFLLSAIMVGFPMVMIESLLAARSRRTKPEMEILAPLARIVPWTIGGYLVVRLGDLLIRRPEMEVTPGQMMAFLAEIVIGLLLPMSLLLQRRVRESSGWLLFAAILVVSGVILNRMNVFIVAYQPPFTEKSYFPAIGEIALTIGLACSIVFLYRLFVYFFPIMREPWQIEQRNDPTWGERLTSSWAWTFRGLAVLALVGFVSLYAVVHGEAVSGEIGALSWARDIAPMVEPERPPTEHSFRPEGYRKVYTLNNRVLNLVSDWYEPARFTHLAHDVATGGDCSLCHHRFSWDADDRVGYDLAEFHLEMEIRIGGPCQSCHEMEELTTQRCASCHWLPNEPDQPGRLGLKGAYHRQCIGCHEDLAREAQAPTDCISCHHPHTPDHRELLALSGEPEPREITARCLECHAQTGEDVLRTAHWRWCGHSPEICGHEHSVELGMETLVNNHLIGVTPNLRYCTRCHIGFGGARDDPGLDDPTRIDCLVCHDETGTYRKAEMGGGDPEEGIDLLHVAEQVGRPSRRNCGSCHFYSDGGANLKHGDLEPALVDPDDELDVHMGRYDMRCQDCHKTSQHRIAGLSMTAPAVEGRVTCEKCHGAEPHGISGTLSRHLDDHVRALACETCHIPEIAKHSPTRMFVDHSLVAGPPDQWPPEAQRWERNVVPHYAWYGGQREAYLLGEKVDPSDVVLLNRPVGERHDPHARIYPFKVHDALQPYDPETRLLVVPKLWQGLWDHGDWGRAIAEGMAAAGLEYSGEFEFLQTRIYTGIHHEVGPAEFALGCGDCHERAAIDCGRCHKSAGSMDQPRHAGMIYPEVGPRFDFGSLGYLGDPAMIGGRFYKVIGRGKPVK